MDREKRVSSQCPACSYYPVIDVVRCLNCNRKYHQKCSFIKKTSIKGVFSSCCADFVDKFTSGYQSLGFKRKLEISDSPPDKKTCLSNSNLSSSSDSLINSSTSVHNSTIISKNSVSPPAHNSSPAHNNFIIFTSSDKLPSPIMSFNVITNTNFDNVPDE